MENKFIKKFALCCMVFLVGNSSVTNAAIGSVREDREWSDVQGASRPGVVYPFNLKVLDLSSENYH